MLLKFRPHDNFKLIIICIIITLIIFYWLNHYNESFNENNLILKTKAAGRSSINYSYSYQVVISNEKQKETFDNYLVWRNENSIRLSGILMGKSTDLLQTQKKVYQLIDGLWQPTQLDSLEQSLLTFPYQIIEEAENWQLINRLDNYYILSFNLKQNPYMLDMFWENLKGYVWIEKNNYLINKIEIKGVRKEDNKVQILLAYNRFTYSN